MNSPLFPRRSEGVRLARRPVQGRQLPSLAQDFGSGWLAEGGGGGLEVTGDFCSPEIVGQGQSLFRRADAGIEEVWPLAVFRLPR